MGTFQPTCFQAGAETCHRCFEAARLFFNGLRFVKSGLHAIVLSLFLFGIPGGATGMI